MLNKVIEEIEKEFQENFPTKEQIFKEYQAFGSPPTWNFTEYFNSKLHSSLLRLISEIKKEMPSKRGTLYYQMKEISNPDEIKGYNQALSEILKILE
jgi:sugar-specific transcriptional regulator TrmB